MVAAGVTRSRLPAGNEVVCTLSDPRVAELAARAGDDAHRGRGRAVARPPRAAPVVVIGNAPTALFRLLEIVAEGGPRPAAVIGVPVGFIGAAESKARARGAPSALEHLVVHGRRGGSAIAAAAVNALASEAE